jgi:hypothetical protein
LSKAKSSAGLGKGTNPGSWAGRRTVTHRLNDRVERRTHAEIELHLFSAAWCPLLRHDDGTSAVRLCGDPVLRITRCRSGSRVSVGAV